MARTQQKRGRSASAASPTVTAKADDAPGSKRGKADAVPSPGPADVAADAGQKKKRVARKGSAAAAAASGDGAPTAAQFPSHPHYLMKSEPDEFSFQDLEKSPGQASKWDGVRNIQAMRLMRGMKVGTQVFFYHSACKVPAIAGIAEVCKEAYPDHTAFTKGHKYFDAKSDEKAPKWHMVDVRFVRPLRREVTLSELRTHGGAGGPLEHMKLLRQSRLSVGPVTQAEWDFILGLEDQPPAGQAGPGVVSKAAAGSSKTGKRKGRGKAADADADGEEEDEEGSDVEQAAGPAAKAARGKAGKAKGRKGAAAAGAGDGKRPSADAAAAQAAAPVGGKAKKGRGSSQGVVAGAVQGAVRRKREASRDQGSGSGEDSE